MSVIRVVIADDSDVARELLARVIGEDKQFQVVAKACNVDELEAAIARFNPHVVTLDLLMPGRNGLTAIKLLRERLTVIVVSDAKHDSAIANESLAQGARAFIPKRSLGTVAGCATLLTALGRVQRQGRPAVIVAIAGSTGAMPALQAFIGQLKDLDAAVALVQHLPADRMASFADWISTLGLPAEVVGAPRALSRGRCLVAPGTHHLAISRGERAILDDSPPLAGHRPSADVLFRSLIDNAPRVLAVVLSGMGRDGAAGLEGLVAAGAACIVQRPDTCPVPSMPTAAQAVSKGRAWPLPAKDIGLAIRGWIGGRPV